MGGGGGHPDPEIRGEGKPASEKIGGGRPPPGPSPGSATVVTVFSFTTAFAELLPNRVEHKNIPSKYQKNV